MNPGSHEMIGVVCDHLHRLYREQHVEQLRHQAATPRRQPEPLHDEGNDKELQAAKVPEGLEAVAEASRRASLVLNVARRKCSSIQR